MNLTPHHIALKVVDLKKCERFYTKILRLPVIEHHHEKNGILRSVWLSLGKTILMLERCEKKTRSRKAEARGWHILALKIPVKKRDHWKAKLKKARIKIINESSYSIYFRDPENNLLALSHYPEIGGGSIALAS